MHKTKLAVIIPLAILLCAFSCHGQVTVGGANAPVINAGPPQNGQVGVLYTFTASASGGTLPYTWSTVPSPAITGVGAINASTGVMTGTPTTGGTYNFTLKVVDANGQQANAPFTVQISNALTITSGTPPNGVAGVAYGPFTFTASGGTLPYTWALASGSFPAGVTLNSSTGVLSGSPVGVGTSLFSVKVTDAVGAVVLAPPVGQFTVVVTGSTPTCGPPGYVCSSVSTSAIQQLSAPFTGSTGLNVIAYDSSINGIGTGITGVDPIVRLTDSTISANSLTVTPSGGANDNIWNTDSTMLIVYNSTSGVSTIVGFNPSTMQYTGVKSSTTYGGFWTWSKTDPHVGYSWRKNGGVPTLFKETCSAPNACVETTVMTTQAACPAPLTTYSPGGMDTVSVSKDDNVFGLMMNDTTQGNGGYAVTYKVSPAACHWYRPDTALTDLGPISDPSCTFNVHAGFIFGNGLWQQVSHSHQSGCPGGSNSTLSFWQIGTTTVNHCNDAGGSAATCTGHDGPGYAIYTIYNDPHWNSRNPATVTTVNVFFTWVTTADSHLSQNNVDTSDTLPIFEETFKQSAPPWTNPYENEIDGIQRTGAAPIRIAHHFASTWTGACPLCDFRDTQAIGAVSQDGKFFAFTSDMLLGLGTATCPSGTCSRQDVFVVRLD